MTTTPSVRAGSPTGLSETGLSEPRTQRSGVSGVAGARTYSAALRVWLGPMFHID
jgi:hypothetical protein